MGAAFVSQSHRTRADVLVAPEMIFI